MNGDTLKKRITNQSHKKDMNKKIPKNSYKQKDKQRKENPDTLCSLKKKKKSNIFISKHKRQNQK